MGSADQGSRAVSELDRYNSLKQAYTNCTYVLGNIEIYAMPKLSGVSLDFFHSITEVSGYIKITGPLPEGITTLPFPNLRIIGGEKLVPYSNDSPKEYSLFIYDLPSLTNLGLTALRGKNC